MLKLLNFQTLAINKSSSLWIESKQSVLSYDSLLHKLSNERSLYGGLQLHAHIIKRGIHSDPFMQAKLISLYFKCQSLEFARMVFNSCSRRITSLVCWNTMITMYCKFGYDEEALSLFFQLINCGLEPDEFTFSVLIKLIARQKQINVGLQFHSLAIKSGYGGEEFVVSSLVHMYAAFDRIDDSVCVFHGNSRRFSSSAWNAMIGKLVEYGYNVDSFELYRQMLEAGIEPTAVTFSTLLACCGDMKLQCVVEQLHSQVIVYGFSSNEITGTALMDAYLKCGQVDRGRKIFDRMQQRNLITWNSIIRGYSEMGCNEQSFELFKVMKKEGACPDKFTYSALLIGVSFDNSCRDEFKSIHANIIKVGIERDCFLGTSVINMYLANNNIENARIAFDDIHPKDIISWSSIVSACVKAEELETALELFTMMINSGIQPSQFIYSSLLTACSAVSKIETGKQIHVHSLKSTDLLDIATTNTLITMYSNCGYLHDAWKAFNSIDYPNLISFNSMISALAQHGCPKDAVKLFDRIKLSGLRPDEISVLNLLSAYNHAGLVQEGMEVFNTMSDTLGIRPTYQHYACIIDMLSRAGKLKEAMDIIQDMPFKANSSLWRIVLGACSKHRNLELGKEIAEFLLRLEPYEAVNYVLFANIYARLGRWAEAENIRNMMKDKDVVKETGISWIEINKGTHKFGVEDQSHPMSEKIYKRLHELIEMIKSKGYVPDISFTLHDINETRREESLYYHSEKLAFAFGDLIAAKGVSLRVMKNLRVCGDCHCAYRYLSVITEREIILRDKYRFHHFKNGLCSCGDYW